MVGYFVKAVAMVHMDGEKLGALAATAQGARADKKGWPGGSPTAQTKRPQARLPQVTSGSCGRGMVALVICNGSRRWKALDASVSCRSASVLFSSGDGAVSVFAGDCMGWWALLLVACVTQLCMVQACKM